MTDEIPEPDRRPGAPHPRDTETLFGQEPAEAAFLDAFRAGRQHHAWLITGPRGVGKATLAWRIARFLLAAPGGDGLFGAPEPPGTLDVAPDHPVARRMRAGSEPRLFHLRRGWDQRAKRLRTEITVDETRKLKGFFGLTAADGGRRAVIVDAADEMNASAANALLKLLEEPPGGATLLLVAHQPARLLPTIRSRCRELRCRPLAAADLDRALARAGVETGADATMLAELAGGSVGAAVDLAGADGPALYAELLGLFAQAPALDRPAAIRLADAAGQRGAETRRDLTLALIELFLSRLARSGAGAPPAAEAATGEAAALTRLAPTPAAARRWAALSQDLSDRAGHALAVNLDPSSVILDMVLKINDTAAAILSRP